MQNGGRREKCPDRNGKNGLRQKENGLEIYVMVEIPSNVLLADEFGKLFDGFSIGSNDLTQLTLGLDRDSSLISYLFNEENPAVKGLIRETIRAAKRNHIKVGLCGQAIAIFRLLPDFWWKRVLTVSHLILML